jgi:hypothetical protein
VGPSRGETWFSGRGTGSHGRQAGYRRRHQEHEEAQGEAHLQGIQSGAFTIYQETYLDDKGNLIPAEAFCVAESRIVLVGNLASLQGVLERNKMPKMSATMTAGRQSAPFANLSLLC